ncbi:pathogenicity island family protein [Staphylococcus succinus]|nr:pathogenicity island family protein [Staphylococcus succinus]
MTLLKNEKESLKRFILNYHLIENEEMLDIEVDDFFQIDSNVATNINETTNVDDHIYMNELDILIDRICDDREYILFMLMSSGRSIKDIATIFGLSESRIYQLMDLLLEKIIVNKEGLNE